MNIFGSCCQGPAARPARMQVITSDPKPPPENAWASAFGNRPLSPANDQAEHEDREDDEDNLLGESREFASNDLAMSSASERRPAVLPVSVYCDRDLRVGKSVIRVLLHVRHRLLHPARKRRGTYASCRHDPGNAARHRRGFRQFRQRRDNASPGNDS